MKRTKSFSWKINFSTISLAMLQPALRISDNEILLLNAVVSVSFNRSENKALLVLELSNHKCVTFENAEAEDLHQRIFGLLSVG